jgi:hypothetical protein
MKIIALEEHFTIAGIAGTTPVVITVLSRYPVAPPGGGRDGELLRDLDQAFRGRL